VHAVFAEVHPTAEDKWVEMWVRSFKEPPYYGVPELELMYWESMAGVYASYSARKNLSIVKRKELFNILLVGSCVSPEDVVDGLDLKTFTKAEAREVLQTLEEKWEQRQSPTE